MTAADDLPRHRHQSIEARDACPVCGPLAAAAHAAAAETPTVDVRAGDVLSWTDRLNMTRQGRVKSVRGDDVVMVTGTGGQAFITRSMIDPATITRPAVPEPVDEESLRAAALSRHEQLVTTRVQAAITDVYESLRDLHPDAEPDDLKIRACTVVADGVRLAKDRLARMIAEAGAVAPRQEPAE